MQMYVNFVLVELKIMQYVASRFVYCLHHGIFNLLTVFNNLNMCNIGFEIFNKCSLHVESFVYFK
jgi:hypothetical protein